jgi:hypothetical protein
LAPVTEEAYYSANASNQYVTLNLIRTANYMGSSLTYGGYSPIVVDTLQVQPDVPALDTFLENVIYHADTIPFSLTGKKLTSVNIERLNSSNYVYTGRTEVFTDTLNFVIYRGTSAPSPVSEDPTNTFTYEKIYELDVYDYFDMAKSGSTSNIDLDLTGENIQAGPNQMLLLGIENTLTAPLGASNFTNAPGFNFFVKTVSSGILGTNGTAGSSGSSGFTGLNGSNGSSGSSGLSFGTSGISGTNGQSGSSGSSGGTGLTGSNGTSGAAGETGSNGTSGAAGETGSSGSSGAAGATGSSGSSGANGTNGATPSDVDILGTRLGGMAMPFSSATNVINLKRNLFGRVPVAGNAMFLSDGNSPGNVTTLTTDATHGTLQFSWMPLIGGIGSNKINTILPFKGSPVTDETKMRVMFYQATNTTLFTELNAFYGTYVPDNFFQYGFPVTNTYVNNAGSTVNYSSQSALSSHYFPLPKTLLGYSAVITIAAGGGSIGHTQMYAADGTPGFYLPDGNIIMAIEIESTNANTGAFGYLAKAPISTVIDVLNCSPNWTNTNNQYYGVNFNKSHCLSGGAFKTVAQGGMSSYLPPATITNAELAAMFGGPGTPYDANNSSLSALHLMVTFG